MRTIQRVTEPSSAGGLWDTQLEHQSEVLLQALTAPEPRGVDPGLSPRWTASRNTWPS